MVSAVGSLPFLTAALGLVQGLLLLDVATTFTFVRRLDHMVGGQPGNDITQIDPADLEAATAARDLALVLAAHRWTSVQCGAGMVAPLSLIAIMIASPTTTAADVGTPR